MPLTGLTLRLLKGAPVLASEEDNNWSATQAFVNGLETRQNKSTDSSGNLLPTSITPGILANGLGTLVDGQTIGFGAGSNALSGQLVMGVKPSAGDTLTLTINGATITITFVSALGGVPGSVLIASTAQATVTNLVGLLLAPATTNTTQDALGTSAQTYMAYLLASANGAVVTLTGTSQLVSLGVTPSTAGNTWIPTQTGQLQVLPGSITNGLLAPQARVQPLAGFTSLVVATQTTAKVAIAAQELMLKDGSGYAYYASGVNLTADISTIGANGMEQVAPLPNTCYYLWVIWNGTTLAALVSASPTTPVLPTAYTFKALVGAIITDTGTGIVPFVQFDKSVFLSESLNVLTFTTTTQPTSPTNWRLRGSGSTSMARVPLQYFVPLTAKIVRGNMGYSASSSRVMTIAGSSGSNTGGSFGSIFTGIVASILSSLNISGPLGPVMAVIGLGALQSNGMYGGSSYSVPVDHSGGVPAIWYQTNTASATAYTEYYVITVTGFELF